MVCGSGAADTGGARDRVEAVAEVWVRTSLLALLPIYKFTLWEPDGA